MKKTIIMMNLVTLSAMVFLTVTVRAQEIAPVEETTPVSVTVKPKPVVQMAILLDTSGSMSGLIDQARTELWSIVNEFIFARRGGMQPDLQVALYEYGKSSLAAKDGYIRQIVPFTTDLDKISEELFALRTNGGEEYCGWVIQEATKSLEWSNSPDDLKVIFISGNEPFTQGPVGYQKSCKDAIAKGIIVNTIHCGSESEGINGSWKNGAVLADGSFLNIDQNRQVVHIEAPQDEEIAELGLKLNETYIAFGGRGGMASQRQIAQDLNAANSSKEAQIQRSVTKSSSNYINSDWDLVDAIRDKKVELEELKEEDLPEDMKNMTVEERKAYTEAKAKERAEIQEKIQELNVQRNNYIAAERKKLQDQDNTLGSAIIKAVREQAVRKNFEFQMPEPEQSEHSDIETDTN